MFELSAGYGLIKAQFEYNAYFEIQKLNRKVQSVESRKFKVVLFLSVENSNYRELKIKIFNPQK